MEDGPEGAGPAPMLRGNDWVSMADKVGGDTGRNCQKRELATNMKNLRLNTLLLTTALIGFGGSQALAGDQIIPPAALPGSDISALQPSTLLGTAQFSEQGLSGRSDGNSSSLLSFSDGELEAEDDVDAYAFHNRGCGGSYNRKGCRQERRKFRREFRRSNAVRQIKARAAYRAGASGAGVIVGVVDEDFDLDHPELAPNIVGFEDVTKGNRLGQEEADDTEQQEALNGLEALGETFLPSGHGTLVSGVIAAARDGSGIHGVAPEAGILAVRADTFEVEEVADVDTFLEAVNEAGVTKFVVAPSDSDDPADVEIIELTEENLDEQSERLQQLIASDDFEVAAAGSGFDDANVARAVDVAVAGGSHIVNLSLGGGETSEQELIDSLQRATGKGVIIVASAGNDDLPNAEAPANLSVDPCTNGLMLAVAQVDEDNEIIEGVNRCGSSAAQCLVALGEDVLTTENGGGLGENSGSSFSAPAVSGSLALLLDLFPTISGGEAVQTLLASATDLGEEGVDEIYGHGLVNLRRALRPIGVASLPTENTVYGDLTSLSSSTLGLSGALGDAFGNLSTLQNSLFLDGFRRPFEADLRGQVVAKSRTIDFGQAFGGSTDVRTESFVNAGGFNVTLALRDDDRDDLFGTRLARAGLAQESYEQEQQLRSLRFSGDIAPGLKVNSGYKLTADQHFATDPASEKGASLFLFTSDSLSPQHAFLGKGSGLSFAQDLTDATKLTIGFLAAEKHEGVERQNGAGTAVQADLNHRFENGAALGFSFSFTNEADGFLGSEAGGALADRSDTNSQIYTLSGSLPITSDIEAIGSATLGLSDLSGIEGGLLSDLGDNVVSDAFALGVLKSGIFDDRDRIGLMFSQPLRIEGGGRGTLTVPTSVNADGSIVSSSERVGLSPSGRELNLQLAYTRELASSLDVTNYALVRTGPGHNADASPDFGVGLRLNWTF